ncbi:Protein RALF-like 27 [Raphanus sativus]|uniref:Protein RALF-like 27 n=1 Tax=Raphanus sativus TaxID=3726 RepID=A0A6J0JNS1_RAPSA|nr:protein RALF-like 27 [Raphanus sativus]KAJ4888154.1 Protein RALF-like 27 [Raphanus sativus]
MNKSVFSFFITVSLLLLLEAASTWNGTSELRNDGCVPGDSVRECIMASAEKEEVVRRILQPRKFISPKPLQRQPALPCKIAGNCIKAVNGKDTTCTYYDRCQRSA